MARLSLTWEADETPPYAFCEPVFATSLRPWCIRKLGKAGLKLGGGIDTPSLCGRVQPSCTSGGKGSGGWDNSVRIMPQHLTHCCATCRAIYKRETV
jgi:hypothetical protein